jgi:hypothetical protein
VDLFENFMNILTLFLAVQSEISRNAMTENGWGKERKINGELAMPILVAGGEGG